jgi:hypothetical protein
MTDENEDMEVRQQALKEIVWCMPDAVREDVLKARLEDDQPRKRTDTATAWADFVNSPGHQTLLAGTRVLMRSRSRKQPRYSFANIPMAGGAGS